MRSGRATAAGPVLEGEESRAVVQTEPARPPADRAVDTPGAERGPGTLAAAAAAANSRWEFMSSSNRP
ncbi:hypothetical protein AB0C33_14880 [Nonomuraea sp. NPDC048881]|uniref:hypothetical protein n=1 Tax=unclassified Nonomuraea TaxID=2593643 RepID=UPI0033FB7194